MKIGKGRCGSQEKQVYTVPSRKQRDGYAKSCEFDSLNVMVLGRAASATEDHIEDQLEELVAPSLEKLTTELNELTTRLESYSGSTDLETVEGAAWKCANEELQRLAVARYKAKLQALEEIFAAVDVFVLTLDCFLQIGSGHSVLSPLFEQFTIVVAYIDEAHNTPLHKVYCAALLVSTLFVLGDEEQFAETYSFGSQRGQGIAEDHTIVYQWEKTLSGPSFLSPWSAMRNGDIFVESTTWRFGPKLCAFLRETVEGYGRSGSAISSPMETPEKYTPDELSRVPSTRLRFVDYHDLHYHTSAHRGCLDPASFLFGYGPPDSSPIGGSLTLFQNMVYEALSFISAYYAGNLRFNEASSLVAIESGTIVVGTMIYLNDILLPFLNYRAEICNRQEVWAAFNLPTECDLETIWVIGTPETLSGDTHLLTQIAIVPQSFQRANLYGNFKKWMQKNRRLFSCADLGRHPHVCGMLRQ